MPYIICKLALAPLIENNYILSFAHVVVVRSVRLNGKVVDAKKYANGKLTLAKSEIDSINMLEVSFVSQKFAESYSRMGLNIYGEHKSVNVAGIVIGVIVGVIVLAGAGFAAWWFLIKNKKQPAAASASGSAKKSTAPKSKSGTAKSKTNNTKKK